jgi:hypothetical protein
VVAGGVAAYVILGSQDRGMTKDGHMVPPASARNAAEAPKFDASKPPSAAKTSDQPPECQLPTDIKLPTEIDISVPSVPEGIAVPADGAKT